MPKRRRSKLYIGTSGWHYLHWKGSYYPKNLSPKKFLRFYSDDFSTVEINNTFYRLPSQKAVKEWQANVPKGFVFSVKMSRYITHSKRLKDPKDPLRKFFQSIHHLKKNVGVILIQLPPHWPLNFERLQQFLKALPKGYRYAFEFREKSWFCPEVVTLLKKHHHALCLYELGKTKTPSVITTNFIYIRLHGPKGAYAGSYTTQALKKWAKIIKTWESKGKAVYCYFDNDEKGYAPLNALKLKELVSG